MQRTTAAVLELFQNACQTYGIPSTVRRDRSFEMMMLKCRGANRGSMIIGSSVHNQRVQRLHRDVASGRKSYIDEFHMFQIRGAGGTVVHEMLPNS